MEAVYRAALAIGLSTLAGTACGFFFSRVTDAWQDVVTAFAAGVMLSAASFGLFAPAAELARGGAAVLLALGAAAGMLFLRLVGALSARFGGKGGLHSHPELMFVLAIAVHKFPEGMAGGVALAGMDASAARTMVIGIALQNLPEGVVMIPPLLSAGMDRRRAALIALGTGLLNAAGVLAGALWGRLMAGLLPLALAFAGGAMLDVIFSRMLPQSAGRSWGPAVTLGGFVAMACIQALCG